MPTLYVAATPIGNLSDASPRLLDTLRNVSLIAAEDTRVTGNLLRHFGIEKPLTSLHRHNENAKAESIVRRMLDAGIDVALVTDAGTPAISDPGHFLVALAHESGIPVLAVAGPSAIAAAVSVSGFHAASFAFYGFFPREKSDLKAKLQSIASGPPIAVFYESPHRVVAFMEMVANLFPECCACVCCDLTKLYEKTIRGNALEVLCSLRDNPKVEKGEYCVVLDLSACPAPVPKQKEPSVEAQLLELLFGDVSMRDALRVLSQSGIRKNEAKRASIRVRQWLDTIADKK